MAETILGISPGTREVGIAVMQNGELSDWNVKLFKGRWSKEKLERILDMLERLYEYHKIKHIALKAVNPLKGSPQKDKLYIGLIAQAQMMRIKISLYTINEMKLSCGDGFGKTNAGLMEFISEKYPILRRTYIKERNNTRPYYLRMFEAVAAARILSQDE